MINILKKKVPVTLGALLAVSPLLADMDARMGKLESQMKDCSTQTARGNYGARTAPADAQLDGYGFFLAGEALLWNMDQDDSNYAVTDTPSGAPINGSTKNISFDWDWGFRTGLGYVAEHDSWGTDLLFTWFQANGNGSVSVASGSQVVPVYGSAVASYGDTFLSASSGWKLHYYDLVWRLDRNFFVSKYLSVRPSIGVKSTWMYNDRNTFYRTASSAGTVTISDHDNFWGIGPQAGLDSKYFFGRHWSFYGNVEGALLWGRNHVTESALGTGTLSGTYTGAVTANKHHVVPYVHLALGFAYDTNFYDDAYNFGISLGYESLYYFRASQLVSPATPSSTSPVGVVNVDGDTMMQGFNLNMTFSF